LGILGAKFELIEAHRFM